MSTNPYSDPGSTEAVHWRYMNDPVFHAVCTAWAIIFSDGLPMLRELRMIQSVLFAITELGFTLVPTDLTSPTANYTPEDVHPAVNDEVHVHAILNRISSEYVQANLTDEDKRRILDMAAEDITMQQLVDYHAWKSRAIQPGRYPCDSATFMLLEADGWRCARCGTTVTEDEVAAWLLNNSTGTPSGE